MKKVLSSLVVLGILLCMFMSLGISADAAEGPKDLAVVAVAGDALTADHISSIKQSLASSDVVIVDVNGLDFEQSGEGYNYAYVDMYQGFEPSGYSFIWPGMDSVPTFTVSDGVGGQCTAVLLPIGPEDTVESINAAVDGYKQAGTAVVIAVAPESCYNVQAAVDSNADKVLTCGEPGVSSDKLIKVGGDSANPVSVVTVTAGGSVNAANMPVPAAADPGLAPVDPSEEIVDPGVDPADIPDPENQTTTYTITFAPGEGASGEMASATANAGESYALPQYCEFSREGYTFIGWEIDGLTYQVFDPVSWEYTDQTITVNSDITATAQWQQNIVQVSVSFAPGTIEGVEITGNAPLTASMAAGSEYALPENEFQAAGYTFQGWSVNGEIKQPHETITVNGDTIVTATWQAEQSETTAYTITFDKGNEGAEGNMDAVTVTEALYKLPDCAFQLEGNHFNGWAVTGVEGYVDPQAAGTEIDLTGSTGITLTATWAADESETVKVNVTYKANNEKSEPDYVVEVILTDGKATHNLVAADVANFTAPDGKEFAGWLVGSETKQPNDAIEVTANVEITAQWKDKSAEPQQNVSPIVEGVTPAGDLSYIQGGTDILAITYKAAIDKVTVNNSELVATQDYNLSADGKTLTFIGGYLNKQLAGTYPMTVTFKADADGTTYANDSRNLVIKASTVTPTTAPTATAEPAKTKSFTWDRAHDLVIDLSEYNMGSPTKLELKYSDTDWREVKAENYAVNGATLTLKTTMLPASWPNQAYTYRVTFGNAPMTVAANGTATNTVQLRLQVTGISQGISSTAAPSPSAASGGAAAPATGDTNNVTLYIVLLVVLIAALAAVLIIVMKRRRR